VMRFPRKRSGTRQFTEFSEINTFDYIVQTNGVYRQPIVLPDLTEGLVQS